MHVYLHHLHAYCIAIATTTTALFFFNNSSNRRGLMLIYSDFDFFFLRGVLVGGLVTGTVVLFMDISGNDYHIDKSGLWLCTQDFLNPSLIL